MQTFFLWNALTIVPDRKQSIAVVGGGGKTRFFAYVKKWFLQEKK